jgi:macrolide-specific efflux system membrane fusion protein
MEPNKLRRLTKKQLFFLGFGLLVLLAAFFFWNARPAVEVYGARRGTAIAAVYGTVKVVPSLIFNVRARAGGVLRYSEPFSKEASLVGREVKAGEFLGEVMNDDLDRAYTKAEADWKAAQERQALGPAGVPALKTAESLVTRLQHLVEQKNIPEVEYERARNEFMTTQGAVRLEQIELDRTSAVIRQEYDNLKVRKELCRFTSPIDGVLHEVSAANGEFINEGSTPFVVVSKTMFLEGQINEEDVSHVSPEMKATVKLYSYPDRTFTGVVTQVRPGANNQRYIVNLTIADPPPNLMLDMTGEMNIVSGEHKDALLIPSRALLGNRIWVVRHGTVKPRVVKVGFRNVERAEILEGVAEGDQVIVADQDLLRTGQRVRAISINQ